MTVTIKHLQDWMDTFIAGILASPPMYDDPFQNTSKAARDHIISHLKSKVERVVQIVHREQNRFDRVGRKAKNILAPNLANNLNEGIISALRMTYDGPGDQSQLGVPRHDNDFVDIQDIRIAPTHQELVSKSAPFLPANLYDAPHPLPNETMERLLDIQFRLLREELIAPLRTSVQLVCDDFQSKKAKTPLSELIKQRGGKYRGMMDTQESIMFNVYTGVKFSSLVPDRRGLSVRFSFDAPPGRARSPKSKARVDFWKGMSGKRMMQGGLVALIWKRGTQIDIHLGVVASSTKDITDSVQENKDRVSARVIFFDPEIELRILHTLKDPNSQKNNSAVMVEAPVMFEAIRPFLEALKVEPESIPFQQYLVHRPHGSFQAGSAVQPPQYARIPGFAYQLKSLFPVEAGVPDLKLYVNDPNSVARARLELQKSRLDRSQADAVVDALTREVALIQGPPGTGKSFTGVELLRVLIPSAKPILMLAFTNHALDHLLTSVLDAGITKDIVRLGGRSADERIKKFSIDELEMVAGRSRLDNSFSRNHWALKNVEEEIRKLMNAFAQTHISSEQIAEFLQTQYPEHSEFLFRPPDWISSIYALSDIEGWQQVGKKSRKMQDSDNTMYAYWLRAGDLEFLSQKEEALLHPPLPDPVIEAKQVNKYAALGAIVDSDSGQTDKDDSDDEDEDEPWLQSWRSSDSANKSSTPIVVENVLMKSPPPLPQRSPSPEAIQITDLKDPTVFFAAHGFPTIPSIPTGDRPLTYLLQEGEEIWNFSDVERERLHNYWEQVVRENTHQNHLEEFARLREKYADALKVYNEGKEEASVSIILHGNIAINPNFRLVVNYSKMQTL
ncbi:hypothetical protein H0H81_012529 [Sphagnurus paluster]|uniref:DNA2/NAM7 helicase helicase domain-containing protein n=1 Tax=Sphagnurus paluster TaxID=117069 RepID=A0A9P7FWN1_9AGAR|nr:hypothetical protein H0H81_012529 [Sphagnurus paluster]